MQYFVLRFVSGAYQVQKIDLLWGFFHAVYGSPFVDPTH